MARIVDLLATGQAFSFEFFPPKDNEEQQFLTRTIADLQPLKPSFVSVTYRGGRISRERTTRVVVDLLNTTDLTPMRAPDLRRLSEKCFDASSPPKSPAFRSCRCRAPAETGQRAFCLSRSSISFWPLRIWICWTDI